MNTKRLLLFVLSMLSCLSTSAFTQVASERSVSLGSRPVKVAFANQTQGNVVAHWIDYDGIAQEIGTIFPNQIVELATIPGHITVFSSGGRQLSTFTASQNSNGTAFGIVGTGVGTNLGVPPQIAVCLAPDPGMTSLTGSPPGATNPIGGGIPGKIPSSGNGLSEIGTLIQAVLNSVAASRNAASNPPGTTLSTSPTGQVPAAATGTGSRLSSPEAQSLVNFHNRVRSDVGAGPVMWDASVATFAQNYADKLAISGKMVHNPNRDLNGVTLGENLAWSSGSGMTVVQLADGWESTEKSLWTPGALIPNGPNPAGHYTQMIWRKSTLIGAGIASGPSGTFLVCNYSPAGNFVGQTP